MLSKNFNKYEEQSKRYISYMAGATLVFLLISLVGIIFIDINSLSNFSIFKDLNGINIIIGAIAIPVCILYYYMYKNSEFFILTLSYTSIFIEYIFVNYIISNVGLDYHLLTFPFITRIVLLTMAIFNESKYSQLIIKRKKLAVFFVLIINIVGSLVEIEINKVGHLKWVIWDGAQVGLMLYYFILLWALLRRCIKKNKFLYTIFITTISIFTIRRIFYLGMYSSFSYRVLAYNRILTFISYSILLLGLYLEIVRRIEESERLNNEVNNFKDLKKEFEEVKEVERAKGQFFANLSHELKTPINIIYSCMQLLDLNNRDGAEQLWDAYNKYDTTIKQNCYRLLRLVNNLVDMTKIDSGYMELRFVNYEIVNLVEEITISTVPYVESKNINVVFDTYVEEIVIRCDPESIERVILNLLSNAVKFTNENGNILVFMDADDEFLTIKVKDDGVGISPEGREAIFNRFVQADKSLSRKKEGSGIGLALVKSLVELHGGKVYLEDNNEPGCEFVIKLPNVKVNHVEEVTTVIEGDNKPLVQKIHLEFSDIYEIF